MHNHVVGELIHAYLQAYFFDNNEKPEQKVILGQPAASYLPMDVVSICRLLPSCELRP